jgi:hypothetical protein
MAFLRMTPVVMLLVAFGCGRAQYTRPIVQPAPLTPAEQEFQAVWDSTRDVLTKYRFKIDQLDRRAGTITTLPQGGRHFFEWWRSDKVTTVGALENTVQPLYRTAKVRIIKKKSDGQFHPVVTLKVSRMLYPPGQIKQPYPTDPDPSRDNFKKKKKKPEYMVIAVGTSEAPDGGAPKRSLNDDVFAKRLADEIRLGVYQQGRR